MTTRAPSTGGAGAAGPRRRRPGGLTTRAAVLGLVVIGLVLTLAYPFREYLSQRAQIAALQEQEAEAQQRVAELTAQRDALDDPLVLERVVRERLHMVRPGETAYVVIGGPPATPAATGVAAPESPQAPWYSQLWQGAAAAGEAR